MYDVIVIGAGPAGSFCGYHLARAGLHVLIAEKSQFPRNKLCGGGISIKAAQLLDGVISFESIAASPIRGSYLSYQDSHLTHTGHESPSYSVNRPEFDLAILQAAQRAGCVAIMPAEVVQVQERRSHLTIRTKSGGSFQSRFIVFAEGINGRLHQQVGYHGSRETTMALEVDIAPRYVPDGLRRNTLFDFGTIEKGYAWIFPKNGFFNVGAYWHRSPGIESSQLQALETFINRFDWMRGGERLSRVRGYPIPYRIKYPFYHTPRTLLIGDIAGAVENFYGEGIYYGFLTGMYAADALRRAIKYHSPLHEYSRRIRSKVLTQMRYSRITARGFYSAQRFSYERMVRNKLMNSLYADLIHGTITQRQAFFRTLGFFPLMPFTQYLRDSDFSEVGLLEPSASASRPVQTESVLTPQ
ncbi:MAG TPA: NAD(P)/FAD-dependent oxidoreductase [Bacteroidota bacterium]|nr:NAD(P)/FAD-dependent oxidoreductase [Bacteroidota bacterium]